jgi:hypothetical protein
VWIFKVENWNLYVKRLEFENLKTKMSKFGCVNIETWKLKTKILRSFSWEHGKIRDACPLLP